jgi:phage baseplate assembly protein W
MAFDFSLGTTCNHTILEEFVALKGVSPFYQADLRFGSNLNYQQIQVREFYETEDNQNYNFFIDGITDFLLVNAGETLQFNNLLFAPGVNFVEGSTFVIPNRRYMANYITKTEDCPKCLGSLVQNDISLSQIGDVVTIDSRGFARQAVEKIILTLRGANLFQTDYGSALSTAIGQKFTTSIFFKIQQTVQDAVQSLIEIQSQALDSLTSDQIILGLSDLSVNQDSNDPRNILITIAITLGDFTTVKSKFNLRV